MGNLMDLSNTNGMSLFKLTVQERILLHLSEFSKFVDQLEVPFALTQQGIAQSVGVVRSAIPRAIKKLISKDHVREELAHITGLSRRRKIYYLTTDGLVFASNLKSKLFTKNITIIIDENQKIDCKIQDVPKKVNKKIRLLDIILNLTSDNVFSLLDFEQLEGSSSTSVAKEVVEESQIAYDSKDTISPDKVKMPVGKKYYIDKAPKISYFVGRKKELKIIHDCINEEKCKMVIVQGIAGIGKTTLAIKLLEELTESYSLFWYRCHEWDILRNILTAISKFFEAFNKLQLKNYLDTNQNIDLNEVAEILELDINGLNAVFFIDDFHKINDQLLGLFTLIREMLERVTGIKFLIFTRSSVQFYDRREVIVKELITELELGGLNEKESKEMLKYRNLEVDNFNQIYELTKGHPLSLELLDPTMKLHEQKNIYLYLEEEVLTRLSIREKSLLKIASVFRYPVPIDGFFIYERAQIGRDTVSILARKSLIKESKDGYEVHDLIKDFFYGYLTPNEQISYHRKIGEFYMNQLKMINNLLRKKISSDLLPRILSKSPERLLLNKNNKMDLMQEEDVDHLIERRSRGILETQYHFLMAKDYNRAAEVAIIMGHELLNLTYAEELLDNLEKIELSEVSDEYRMDLKILKGDVLFSLSNYSGALELYKESIGIAKTEDNKTKLAELYRKLGTIQEKLNDFNTAIEFLNKSLDISKMLNDAKSTSDTYGCLGDVYWKMSEFNKSNEFYNKSMESAEEIADLPGRAKTYLSLGLMSAKRGQFEESIKYYERCLDILDKRKVKERINYYDFYENLSDHYLKTIFSLYIQSSEKDT